MQIDTPHAISPTEKNIPNLVVMSDRVIIHEHHHSSVNRYMWESSDITNSYSKSTLDFNNCEDMCGEFTDKDERDNHRP